MFDIGIHVLQRDESEMKTWYLAMDEGFTNPAVILLVGADNDKRLHIFKEWYKRGKLRATVVTQAVQWTREKRVRQAVVDSSAAGLIADLLDAGVPAAGAKGRVLDGIQSVQNRLKVQGDERPRLTVDPSCVETINEFESYTWKTGAGGMAKDEPIKEYDHAMDAIRYLDNELGAFVPMTEQPEQPSKFKRESTVGWASKY
jgi:phage terminase large subunit